MADGVAARDVARSGVAGLAGAAASAASQFLIVLVVTRAFDPGTAGAFFTLTATCLMIAGILRLDTTNGLIYFIARSPTHDGDHHQVYGNFRIFFTALGPVLLLSLCVGGIAVAHGYLLGAVLPVIVCADVLVGATRGFGSMRPTVLLSGLLQPVAQLALVTAVALACAGSGALGGSGPPPGSGALGETGSYAGSGALGGLGAFRGFAGEGGSIGAGLLAAAWALPYVPVVVLSVVWLARRPPHGLAGTGRDFWCYTAPRSLGGAVQCVFQRLDIVIVAMLAGPAQAAIYTAATRFKVVGQLAGQGLAQAVQPRLVRALAEGDLDRARALYQAATMWLVVLTWPIWLGYAALAPWLLRVFGDVYSGGTGIALVLAATMMVATACGMVDVVLIAAGHTTTSLVNIVIATAVTVLADVSLIPAHGALGAAIGWAAGVIVKNLLPLIQITRHYGLRPFGRHSLSALRLLPPIAKVTHTN